MKHLKKWQFYLLSFTWGLPLSLAGVLVCGVLVLFGYHVKRYGHLYYIAIGESWGGLELGWFFLVSVPEKEAVRQHELGHGYQNACLFGFFMPVLCIISAVRYWIKQMGVEMDYYAWWFEAQASRIGKNVMEGETE